MAGRPGRLGAQGRVANRATRVNPCEQRTTCRGARGGSAARRKARGRRAITQLPYIKRTLPPSEVLDDEGLDIIETNAETVLAEIGIEFRDDAEALALWREAGADVRHARADFGAARRRPARAPPRRAVPLGRLAVRFQGRRRPGRVRERADAARRANALWKKMLAEYEAPPIDPAIDEARGEFIAKKKASMPDAFA